MIEESVMVGKLFKAKTNLWSRSFSMDAGEIALVANIEDPATAAAVWQREITCLINGKVRKVNLVDFKRAVSHGELEVIGE